MNAPMNENDLLSELRQLKEEITTLKARSLQSTKQRFNLQRTVFFAVIGLFIIAFTGVRYSSGDDNKPGHFEFGVSENVLLAIGTALAGIGAINPALQALKTSGYIKEQEQAIEKDKEK